jgi:hypothetical protein
MALHYQRTHKAQFTLSHLLLLLHSALQPWVGFGLLHDFVPQSSIFTFLFPISLHTLVLLYTVQNYSLEPSQHCKFFQGAVAGRTPNPLPRRTGVSLLVWAITFDLSGMGGPNSSYATASIALRII